MATPVRTGMPEYAYEYGNTITYWYASMATPVRTRIPVYELGQVQRGRQGIGMTWLNVHYMHVRGA